MPTLRDLYNLQKEYRDVLHARGAAVERAILPRFEEAIALFAEYRSAQQSLQNHQQESNQLSEKYARTKDEAFMQASKALKNEMQELSQRVSLLEEKLKTLEVLMPNWLDPDIPGGAGDEAEKPLSYVGVPRVFRDHLQEAERLYPGVEKNTTDLPPFPHYNLVGWAVDQETAGNVAQSRFYYEMGDIALLDLALTMYTVEFFRTRGFPDLMVPPYLMRRSVEERITYFEAFQDTIFEVDKDGLLLIPSSEHPIVAYYADRIFEFDELPVRVMAYSPCFRREAGAHGKETRGIFRVKQFHKVELHSIVREGEDHQEVERIVSDVQDLMSSLGLPTRSVIVPSEDMDKRALKQIDVETWLPEQARYRETHSIATLGTWVSEKMGLRYRPSREGKSKKPVPARNVYATAIAVQRTICALSETHYDHARKSIIVPEPLRKYTMGVTSIAVPEKFTV